MGRACRGMGDVCTYADMSVNGRVFRILGGGNCKFFGNHTVLQCIKIKGIQKSCCDIPTGVKGI